MVWAGWLIYYDSVRDVNLTGWRLATALTQDGSGPCISNCNDSEMGRLFCSDGITSSSQAPFNNVQPNHYWSGTEDFFPGYARDFNFLDGWQDDLSEVSFDLYAWAVRDGDAASVPEPSTNLLLGIGLVGIALMRRKFRVENPVVCAFR